MKKITTLSRRLLCPLANLVHIPTDIYQHVAGDHKKIIKIRQLCIHNNTALIFFLKIREAIPIKEFTFSTIHFAMWEGISLGLRDMI